MCIACFSCSITAANSSLDAMFACNGLSGIEDQKTAIVARVVPRKPEIDSFSN